MKFILTYIYYDRHHVRHWYRYLYYILYGNSFWSKRILYNVWVGTRVWNFRGGKKNVRESYYRDRSIDAHAEEVERPSVDLFSLLLFLDLHIFIYLFIISAAARRKLQTADAISKKIYFTDKNEFTRIKNKNKQIKYVLYVHIYIYMFELIKKCLLIYLKLSY